MRTRIVLALALALVFATGAAAQQVQPVIYIADFHVQPGKEGDFLDVVNKYHSPMFDKLIADGAVQAWGVDVPWLHTPGASTHTLWWACPNMAGMDKVNAAIAEMSSKMGEDGSRARFMGTIDLSKHMDFLLRDLVIGDGPNQPSGDAKPYLWLVILKVQPGKGQEYRRLWEQYNKPVYDKLAADGVIHGYALGVQEAIRTDAFTHYVAVSMPNLAARDKIRAAFEADREARTPADRSIITNSFQAVVEAGATRNEILRSVVFKAAAPPK
jgi:hypothetical protein